ncbi:MAG TPA: hypothetical protein VGZ48_10430 [Candidatus Acidoferrales bacterium]|nr:hypothetical protein [Candidatus Acidoferrales bacterium]
MVPAHLSPDREALGKSLNCFADADGPQLIASPLCENNPEAKEWPSKLPDNERNLHLLALAGCKKYHLYRRTFRWQAEAKRLRCNQCADQHSLPNIAAFLSIVLPLKD